MDKSRRAQPVKEVVRRSPAALQLWAVEAMNKEIEVLSDPHCVLVLRYAAVLQTDVTLRYEVQCESAGCLSNTRC